MVEQWRRMISDVAGKVAELKDELFRKLILSLTGKQFVDIETDVPRLKLVYHDALPGREFVSWDDNIIGEIVMGICEGENNFTISFQLNPMTTPPV